MEHEKRVSTKFCFGYCSVFSWEKRRNKGGKLRIENYNSKNIPEELGKIKRKTRRACCVHNYLKYVFGPKYSSGLLCKLHPTAAKTNIAKRQGRVWRKKKKTVSESKKVSSYMYIVYFIKHIHSCIWYLRTELILTIITVLSFNFLRNNMNINFNNKSTLCLTMANYDCFYYFLKITLHICQLT